MCSTIFEKHLSHEAVKNQYLNNIFVQTGAQNVFFLDLSRFIISNHLPFHHVTQVPYGCSPNNN